MKFQYIKIVGIIQVTIHFLYFISLNNMMKNNKRETNENDEEFMLNLPTIPNTVLIKPFLKKQYRRTFSKEEDERLKYLVNYYGKKSWSKISDMMPFRTSRQCKERYEGYLSPNINHDNFSPEEDRIILEKYKELGTKWNECSNITKESEIIKTEKIFNFFGNPGEFQSDDYDDYFDENSLFDYLYDQN